jgi:hypothetical protein
LPTDLIHLEKAMNRQTEIARTLTAPEAHLPADVPVEAPAVPEEDPHSKK